VGVVLDGEIGVELALDRAAAPRSARMPIQTKRPAWSGPGGLGRFDVNHAHPALVAAQFTTPLRRPGPADDARRRGTRARGEGSPDPAVGTIESILRCGPARTKGLRRRDR
jgi:hypothetical protein